VREWLPADHLAWFVIDVVAAFDAAPFLARCRADGRGGAAYDPMVMVAVLVYAYCVGERSSRRIERLLCQDVAFRVVARNLGPDHATIARFRAGHDQALAGLFVEVLGLCERAGLVGTGLVAVDGTKIKASASMDANRDEAGLRKALEDEARRILDEAARVDAEEDALYGDARGDELPAEFADPTTRAERIRAALERLRAERAESVDQQAAAEARRQATGQRKRGRKPNPDRRPDPPPRANMTDPDSRTMRVRGGFVQGYNAQAAVAESQVILAAELTNQGNDVGQFGPMLDAMGANLESIGRDDTAVSAVVADAGYYSTENASLDPRFEVLIATANARKLPEQPPPPRPDRRAEFNRYADQRAAEIAAVLDRVMAGELTFVKAGVLLGVTDGMICQLRDRYRQSGIDAIRPRRYRRGSGQRLPPKSHHSVHADVRDQMQARLASPDGKQRYKRRSVIVEPVFGQTKAARRIDRFSRRGLPACSAEWKLIAATHNLLKAWRHHNQLAAPAC
jgi:transposase